MARRGDAAERPRSSKDWALEFDTQAAAENWDRIAKTHGNVLSEAWDQLTHQPMAKSERQHQLKADYSHRTFQGASLEQWQYEFSGSGRIWYCIDEAKRRLLLTLVEAGHPRGTDGRRRRKRG
jgi:hypothetical protein